MSRILGRFEEILGFFCLIKEERMHSPGVEITCLRCKQRGSGQRGKVLKIEGQWRGKVLRIEGQWRGKVLRIEGQWRGKILRIEGQWRGKVLRIEG